MAPINILPENLSNKIAAGEVVERPASVVKELVENAIDAGSTAITVEVEQGGRSLIRVVDDGVGMVYDDALLCLERYATSKLADEQDLFSIGTLGFRGEALPSIAAVSDFTLVTRPADTVTATEIRVSGGKIKAVKEAGAPPGTMVEVRRLFFNTPARRKYLKSVNTEIGHIADMVAAFALGRHDIRFKLIHNKKIVKNWSRTNEPVTRIVDVLGRETGDQLHPLKYTDKYLSISGWIASPLVTRRTGKRLYLFINGRLVRDRGLQYALFEGYHGRLVKGTFPVAAVFLEIPFDRLDVNVHPTKSTVKLADPKRVYESLKATVAAVWEASAKPPWEGASPPSRPTVAEMPPGVSERLFSYTTPGRQTTLADDPGTVQAPPAPTPSPSHPPPTTEEDRTAESPVSFFSSLSVVGQFQNAYIVAESELDMVLIDQHAAHERILFEHLKKRDERQPPARQGLLVPETVELSYREAAALEELLPDFGHLGLEIERFGQNTYVIKAVPEILAETEAGPLVTELAGKLAATGPSPDIGRKIEEGLHVLACHGAIRAGQRLTSEEMRALLSRLDDCINPWHCPHGRPTAINWRTKEIERSFKRVL